MVHTPGEGNQSMSRKSRGRNLNRWSSSVPEPEGGKLRIVGGRFGGRQIAYSGDPLTRPMKDNTREALFNLIGGWIKGRAAFDLFAGTGAVGIEAISRGATRAYMVERHFPTARLIRENVKSLDPEMNVQVDASDTFFWVRQFMKDRNQWPSESWMVFFCPPYALFQERTEDLLSIIGQFLDAAPPDSVLVVESDRNFDPELLPRAEQWRVREYAPARIAVWRPPADNSWDTK